MNYSERSRGKNEFILFEWTFRFRICLSKTASDQLIPIHRLLAHFQYQREPLLQYLKASMKRCLNITEAFFLDFTEV